MTQIDTPVLLLVFNRPDLTRRLIQSLEKVKPKNIFVVADGPRNNSDTDKKRCAAVRQLFDHLNWPCQISKMFREENLGCARSVSQGITWFFKTNEKGIILEDDCIADPSFFTFCETLLEKYQNQKEIFHISGNNFQYGKQRGKADYYFSIFNHLWGWASWKRAWNNFEFDIDIQDVEDMREFVNSDLIINYFSKQFQNVNHGKIDSWGFRWTFACWKNKGVSILPNMNLVSNIGFVEEATHTHQIESPQSNIPVHTIKHELIHPSTIKVDKKADLYSFRKIFQSRKNLRYYIEAAKRKAFN